MTDAEYQTVWNESARKYGSDNTQDAIEYVLKGSVHPADTETYRRLILWKARLLWIVSKRKNVRNTTEVSESRSEFDGGVLYDQEHAIEPEQLKRVELRQQLTRLDPRLIDDEIGTITLPRATKHRVRVKAGYKGKRLSA